ncbi:MAG: DUF1289 domain-containing protein [Rubrivivax sp.]|nr:DUF1289 domain-containing protein [Rubrivivax sp.]
MTVPSPCISVCRMDQASGWCEGCLRTLDEIAAWSLLDEEGKRAVWVELSRRRVQWRERRAAASDGARPEAR